MVDWVGNAVCTHSSTKNFSLISLCLCAFVVNDLRAGVAPASNFFQPFAPVFEKAYPVPGVLEFVNVGPYLSLLGLVMYS